MQGCSFGISHATVRGLDMEMTHSVLEPQITGTYLIVHLRMASSGLILEQ
jgi:hypothetical protein